MLKTLGRYQILEKIGQGGMGTVYKAFDPLIGRTVAVKVIATQFEGNPHLRERFFREARAAGQLSHKNIIIIHDLGEVDEQPYLAMEFLEGTNLDARMRSVGRMRVERTLQVVAETCEGLEYAHRHGVIHRDIKPANIFITDSGQVKLLDFGLARLVSSELTRSNTVIGTVNYMSPEQIRGLKVDHRADIFSVGVVLYEMLTGKKAFEGDSFATTIFKILQETPEPPHKFDPSIPASVAEIVDRAMAKARDERYQSIGEMLRDIMVGREALKGTDPALTLPAAAQRPPSDPPRPVDSPAPVPIAARSATPPPDPGSGPFVGAAGTPVSASHPARRRALVASVVAAGAAAVAGGFWIARREAPAPAGRTSPATVATPTAAPEAGRPAISTPTAAAASGGRRREVGDPAATQGTETARGGSPPQAPRAALSRRERAAEEESRRAAAVQPSVKPSTPAAPQEQRTADEALAQVSGAKAAAETAGAASLAPAFYSAASEAEREGRDRYQSGQFGQAAARFYEAAGLFRSAQIVARDESAARAELARRADEAAKVRARQAAEPPRAAMPVAPEPRQPAPSRGDQPAAPPPEELVRQALARYSAALEARSIDELRKIWPTMAAEQRRAILSEFENARSIRVQLIKPQIHIAGDTATVTVLRRYELLTTDGHRLQSETRTTMVLQKADSSWLIDDVRHQAVR